MRVEKLRFHGHVLEIGESQFGSDFRIRSGIRLNVQGAHMRTEENQEKSVLAGLPGIRWEFRSPNIDPNILHSRILSALHSAMTRGSHKGPLTL